MSDNRDQPENEPADGRHEHPHQKFLETVGFFDGPRSTCNEQSPAAHETISANQTEVILSLGTEEEQHEEFKRILYRNVQTLKDRMWRSPAYHVGRLEARAEARAEGWAEGQVIERVRGLVTVLATNDVELSPEEVEWLEALPLTQLPEVDVALSSRTRAAFWQNAGLTPDLT